MKKIIGLIVLFALMTNCSNDNNADNTSQTPEIQYVKKIIKDGVDQLYYEYDNGKIKKLTYYYFNDYSIYDYSDLDTLKVLNYSNDNEDLVGYRKNYKLDENTIRQEYYSSDNLTNYRIYKYNSNGCGFYEINFYNLNIPSFRKGIFSYTENCGYTAIYYDENNQVISYQDIVTDGKNNPYYTNYVKDFLKVERLHNTVKNIDKNELGEIVNNSSYESTFIYNEFDYPIKETRVYLNGITEVYTFEYY
ncbi:MAG: hypothetical protein R2786_10645 [Flavobacteriaceae bacterium]